jgi:predicted anti-sigma-YlaC factor YlaD
VTCEQVREHLPEHLLGTLDTALDAQVRGHLRGCASCRREAAALAEGLSTFARAAHDVDPPAELRDRVLSILDEEWRSAPDTERAGRKRLALAVVAAALVAAVAWGAVFTVRAVHSESSARKYEALLGALGGENVRVGKLRSTGTRRFEGSVVLYDSRVGQSWALVLVRAPGMQGEANVGLVGDGGTIGLPPLRFSEGGEASTLFVTSGDLGAIDGARVWDTSGVIATCHISSG